MRTAFLFFVALLACPGQDRRAELSVSAGVGIRGAENLESGGYSTWTAGGGYRLNDQWTVKGEFSQHRPGVVNLFSGSVMREWDRGRFRPFGEFGVGAGWQRFRTSSIVASPGGVTSSFRSVGESNGYLGVLAAGGITVDFLDRYFVRPQVRMHIMGPIYFGLQPAVAVGVRF